MIEKHLPVLHSNQNMRKMFRSDIINVTYKRGENLREFISPSLFPRVDNQHSSSSGKKDAKKDVLLH